METLVLHLIYWIVNHGSLDRPKRVNETVLQAEHALQRKDYATASRQFRYLVDSLRFTGPAARLDLAHSLFEEKDTLHARQQYQRLDSIVDVQARSVALQQLGVLAGNRNENERALAYFKQTLRADPSNEDARYDYELLKKKVNQEQQKKEQPKEDQKDQKNQSQDKKQDQQKKEQQQKEQQEKEQKQKAQDQQQKEDQKGKEDQQKEQQTKDGKKSDERKATEQKLKAMNLSEEKARMILDAMKNSEIQYLQQKRREKTKKSDRNLPDW